MLWASQVAPGNENALKLRVYGTKGGLEWQQEDPNYLWFTPFGQEKRADHAAGAGAGEAAARMSRVPPGHPEGYLEGFANIYSEAADAILAHRDGSAPPDGTTFPDCSRRSEGRSVRRCLCAVIGPQRRLGEIAIGTMAGVNMHELL